MKANKIKVLKLYRDILKSSKYMPTIERQKWVKYVARRDFKKVLLLFLFIK